MMEDFEKTELNRIKVINDLHNMDIALIRSIEDIVNYLIKENPDAVPDRVKNLIMDRRNKRAELVN